MVYDREITTRSARETAEVGRELAVALKQSARPGRGAQRRINAATVCLYGELGSGKTTFIRGFVRGLGLTSRLPSPTYIIVRRYKIPGHIYFYHADLYRVTEEDVESLGLSEFFADYRSFVAVEWAEKLGGLLPKSRTDIRFSLLEDGSRMIIIKNVKE